jgi:hypothetical protein
MGRTPLTEDQVRAKVLAYCGRYGVSPGPESLPPFPTGQRETRQHREWLTVYRALQRARARAAVAAPVDHGALSATPECPVCSRSVERDLAIPYSRRAAKPAQPVPLHPACAELARLADTLGPAAVEGLRRFLWPGRAGTPSSPRPPRR